MAQSKDRSLGELEATYQQKLEYWTDQRADLVTRLAHVDEQLRACEEKLRWVRTLIVSPDSEFFKYLEANGKRRSAGE